MEKQYYAHQIVGKKEPLEGHLHLVGQLAGRFGDAFGSGKVTEQMGLIHDLGKAYGEIQGGPGA